MNGGIINYITRLHLVVYFYWVILRCTDSWILNFNESSCFLCRVSYFKKTSIKDSNSVKTCFEKVSVHPHAPLGVTPNWTGYWSYSWRPRVRATWFKYENNQQDELYRLICYSNYLNMFRAMFSTIIRSICLYLQYLVVFTPSSCRLVSWMSWN
jgi:hypothetical protein